MVQIGDTQLRAEIVDATVKGFAPRMYKFRQAFAISPTSAISNVYWTEASAALTTAGDGNDINDVPFGANFPNVSITNTRRQNLIVKHAVEENIPWELIRSSEIDIQGRTLFKATESVVKSVDDAMYNGLTGDDRGAAYTGGVPASINFFRVAVGKQWNWSASAAIFDDLGAGLQKISKSNYSTQNVIMFINGRDRRSIMNYLFSKGSQIPQVATDIVMNGFVTRVAGVDLVESNSVPASQAVMCVPKICATWKEFVPLTTDTFIDPLKSVRIRIVEEGIVQRTDPEAIVFYVNTQNATDES